MGEIVVERSRRWVESLSSWTWQHSIEVLFAWWLFEGGVVVEWVVEVLYSVVGRYSKHQCRLAEIPGVIVVETHKSETE